MDEDENFDHHKPCRWEPSISPEELAEDLASVRQAIGDRFVDQYVLDIARDAMKLMEHMAAWSRTPAAGQLRMLCAQYVTFGEPNVDSIAWRMKVSRRRVFQVCRELRCHCKPFLKFHTNYYLP
jgi:hypothetical protein